MKNKVLKTLTLTTVAATALVAQQAYADEVAEAPTSSSSNTTNAEASTIVTAEQVADAKAIADTAANQVADQQASLVTAEETARTAQTDLHQAEQTLASAQELAAKATNDTIATAEKAIISAEQKVVDAQNQVTSGEQTTTTAQEQADKAQTEANKAKDAADLAKSQADNSKADLEALQNSQEEQAINKAQEDLKAAQEEVANKTTAVTTAEQNLETAKASDAKLEADRASAKEVLAEQTQKVTAAQTTVTEKESELEVANQNLVIANEKLEAVKPKTTYKFSINLPDYLRDAYANLVKSNFSEDSIDAAIQAEKRYYGDGQDKVDKRAKLSYATIESTDTTLYDVENLDKEQLLLLNQFAIDYTNAYREVLGIDKKLAGNEWLIQVADVRARLYDEKYPEGVYGHDWKVISAANKEVFGERPVVGSGSEILAYPNISSSGAFYNQNTNYYTMSEILHVIAEGINSFMLNDSGSSYGHFDQLMTYEAMGFDLYYTYNYSEQYQSGLGNFTIVGAGKNLQNMYREYNDWDVIEETDSRITLGNPATKHISEDIGHEGETDYFIRVNLSKQDYETYTRFVEKNITSRDLSAYEAALKEQNVAQSSYKAVQSEYEKAVKELSKAQDNFTSAQSTYNAVVNTPLQTPEAEKALEVARVNLASAQEVLETAQNQWQLAEAKAATLATEIAKAQTTYDTLLATATKLKDQADAKQADADKAKDNLAQAQAQLEEARQAVARAEKEVISAKDNLSTLKEAQVNLVKAQEAYALAQADAKQADQNLSEAQAKLADFKVAYKKAYADYLALNNIYDLQTMVTPQPEIKDETKPETPFVSPFAEDQSKSDAKTIADGFKTKDEAAVIVTKTWQPGIIVKEDGSVTYSRLAKSQTLPATGEKETGLLSLLGLTALATGLGLTARRRHRG
ncbi:SEC10/PgrA surface exclusion domain-containing protein [Streptococcus orisratti]|uniref:SEC10/PgrA surface exclusion domain-containing protein n=1 Tax=Streptococcus orisratti TaxID=114652 RepID=UPI003D022619